MNIKPNIRLRMLMLKTEREIVERFKGQGDGLGLQSNCINCSHWNNGCMLAESRMPPPEIIAYGCERWDDNDDIPF